jgi:hypothetical protein
MTVLDIDPPLAALNRLIAHAQSDTGQSKRVADFLLAWWNADDCGRSDFCDLWMLDKAIADDILAVLRLIALRQSYPDATACASRSSSWSKTGARSSSRRTNQLVIDTCRRGTVYPPARARAAEQSRGK